MLLILVLLPWVLYSFGVAAVSVLAKSAAADAFAVYAWVLHVLLTCALAFNILGDFYLQRVFLTAQRESLTRFVGSRASSIYCTQHMHIYTHTQDIQKGNFLFSAIEVDSAYYDQYSLF